MPNNQPTAPPDPRTLGELRANGYRHRTVKEEARENLIRKMRAGETIFPGIIGYDRTVIPQVQRAVLAQHDFILLGLRGQAKTRLIRSLTGLLDPYIPIVDSIDIPDDPMEPAFGVTRRVIGEKGDDTPIRWISREERFQEKLATPDVSVADLIGDIDPVKVMSRRLELSDESAIHYGIIPRSNRGIFAFNELPDLQPRIQVSLLNILEENDIQIRGFPVRIPLDLMIVFTANPEDYTNRGSIITPLKDRIDAQILTHYPRTLEEAMEITVQESRIPNFEEGGAIVPDYMREIAEQIAFEARESEYVDQGSGVSQRLAISLYETLHSAVEHRMVLQGSNKEIARMCDLFHCVPAMTGKMELVFKGEQEGLVTVSHRIIGQAIRRVFDKHYTPKRGLGPAKKIDSEPFREVVIWFEKGNQVDLSDELPFNEYFSRLRKVEGLEKVTRDVLKPEDDLHLAAAMEFTLEGLVQHYLVSKKYDLDTVQYVDTVSDMMRQL
ncbi:MAG: magnesium chelatase [Candidatus Omnitrophica bacterium]|nr:magnesium chelatase [Candidatus Omnitrophota bacterium]